MSKNMLKVIRTPDDHAAALRRIKELILRGVESDESLANELEVLALLAEDYEKRMFPIAAPDPIEAIKVRMDERSLTQRNLVPMIGSKSKVSEVLAGKRPLTLAMIRALSKALDIPADILLQEHDPSLLHETDIEWDRFPLAEMHSLGWISATRNELDDAELVLKQFLGSASSAGAPAALFRMTRTPRAARTMDSYAVRAWLARVVLRAREVTLPTKYAHGSITLDTLREIAQLSWSALGPRLAVEFLAKKGVVVVVEQHLAHTHIDGAVMLLAGGSKPVIGLTLRHDRIDNFWFCLMHELAHLIAHLGDAETDAFIDDLDSLPMTAVEEEADKIAGEALIPTDEWSKTPLRHLISADAAIQIANQFRVHPAIVAGRIRHDRKNFRVLGQLVGAGEVQKLFPEVHWKGGK